MKKLSGADGIRAIACLMVIFHHAFQRLAVPVESPFLVAVHSSFNNAAPAGVSIFFVLSGFLLAKPFWERYFTGGDFPNIKLYVLRRAGRIIPAFYIALTATFIFQFFFITNNTISDLILRYLAGLTFVAGFHWKTFFPAEFNGPLWSVSFEVFSYLLLPLSMMPMFFRNKKERTLVTRSIIAIVNWMAVIALLFSVNGLIQTYLQTDPVGKGWEYGLQGGAKFWMPGYNPPGFFAHFALGIMASCIMHVLQQCPVQCERLSKFFIFDVLAIVSLAAMYVLFTEPGFIPFFKSSFQGQPYFYPYFALTAAIALAVLPYTRFCAWILDNPFFRFTARISFGLYLWHYLLFSAVELIIDPKFHYWGIADTQYWFTLTMGVIAVSYLIATLSWNFIEKPILDKVHKKTTM
jgi:peptidoglycan/LPS O-acetylase OafA/YrhL